METVHRKAWDCYPFEVGAPYAAFSQWLHAGAGRPVPSVWAALTGDARVNDWAQNGLWAQRAALYDMHQATRHVVVHVPLLAGITPRLLALVEARLRDLERMTSAGQLEAVTTPEMIQLVRALLAIQRECARVQEASPPADDGGGSDFDYSKLTVDELRELHRLTQKATLAEGEAREVRH